MWLQTLRCVFGHLSGVGSGELAVAWGVLLSFYMCPVWIDDSLQGWRVISKSLTVFFIRAKEEDADKTVVCCRKGYYLLWPQEVLVLCLTLEEEDAAHLYKLSCKNTLSTDFSFLLFVPVTSIFYVFCCFKHIPYPSLYPSLSKSPYFSHSLFHQSDPHSYAPSHSPTIFSHPWVLVLFCPYLSTDSLSPPLLHYSPLPISSPIPVFLVSG